VFIVSFCVGNNAWSIIIMVWWCLGNRPLSSPRQHPNHRDCLWNSRFQTNVYKLILVFILVLHALCSASIAILVVYVITTNQHHHSIMLFFWLWFLKTTSLWWCCAHYKPLQSPFVIINFLLIHLKLLSCHWNPWLFHDYLVSLNLLLV
jgi:hypothetical protein